jgi:hypothetical protein
LQVENLSKWKTFSFITGLSFPMFDQACSAESLLGVLFSCMFLLFKSLSPMNDLFSSWFTDWQIGVWE